MLLRFYHLIALRAPENIPPVEHLPESVALFQGPAALPESSPRPVLVTITGCSIPYAYPAA